MAIITIKDLNFKYPLQNNNTLTNISFKINEGEFVTLCGPTGCGKTTLLKCLKKELLGERNQTGEILFYDKNLNDLTLKQSSTLIGYVMQNPHHQIVTDKVWHELAFGLENLNIPQKIIAKRVAEMASYFGIEGWFDKNVNELSGGQKQLLNLASVMVMNPKLLILDEPTAQLDPISANNFISTLKKINNDFGLTIIITEHRLEELIPICDRLLVLQNGQLIHNGNPRDVIKNIKNNDKILSMMPVATRLYNELGYSNNCPLTVKEGRNFIENNYKNTINELQNPIYEHSKNVVLEFKEVYFKYKKDTNDILKGLNFKVYEQEIYCIVGGNGSGKSTTMNLAAGLYKPYSGTIKIFNKKIKEYINNSLYRNCLSLLPQDVQTVFLRNTVREELDEIDNKIGNIPFEITHLLDQHPYDLSGGEQQLIALIKVLLTKPKIILMDEPTKGLDASIKKDFIKILKYLKSQDITIIIVTHDIEFAAICADRCALFFRGDIVSEAETKLFFAENKFYTTTAARMTDGYYNNTVTIEDIIKICKLNNGEINDIN